LRTGRGRGGVNVDANIDQIELCRIVRSNDTNLCLGIGDNEGFLPLYTSVAGAGLNSFIYENIKNGLEYFKLSDDMDSTICKVITLGKLLDDYCGGFIPELFSLDVEGFDMKVLNSANKKSFDKNIVLITERSGLSPQILGFAKNNDYFLYMNTPGNHIFVKNKYHSLLLST
jgi:hypothetical protein